MPQPREVKRQKLTSRQIDREITTVASETGKIKSSDTCFAMVLPGKFIHYRNREWEKNRAGRGSAWISILTLGQVFQLPGG
jgi:hypothetical protein